MTEMPIIHLRDAEAAVLEAIAAAPQERPDEYYNYSRLGRLLDLANEIGLLRKKAQDLFCEENAANDSEGKNAKDGAKRVVAGNVKHAAPTEFKPVFFFENDHLFKYASGRKAKGGIYRRSVPESYVFKICEAVCLLVSSQGYATAQAIEKCSNVKPPYRVQVTLGALVEAGVLKHLGRGRYQFARDGISSAVQCFEELRRLPLRRELVAEYKAARS